MANKTEIASKAVVKIDLIKERSMIINRALLFIVPVAYNYTPLDKTFPSNYHLNR